MNGKEDFDHYNDKIVDCIKSDNLEKAISLFFELVDSNNSRYSDLILESGAYQRMKRAYDKGIIDYETMSRNKNRIGDALLSVLGQLKDSDVNETIEDALSSGYRQMYFGQVSNNQEELQFEERLELIERIVIEFAITATMDKVDDAIQLRKIIQKKLSNYNLIKKVEPKFHQLKESKSILLFQENSTPLLSKDWRWASSYNTNLGTESYHLTMALKTLEEQFNYVNEEE